MMFKKQFHFPLLLANSLKRNETKRNEDDDGEEAGRNYLLGSYDLYTFFTKPLFLFIQVTYLFSN